MSRRKKGNGRRRRGNVIRVHKIDVNTLNNIQQFLSDPAHFILSNFSGAPTLSELSDILNLTEGIIRTKLDEHECSHLITFSMSIMENDVCDFIKSIDPTLTIIHNDRSQIKPYELDIYLPDVKVAIECDPSFTHNSSPNRYSNRNSIISKDYHKHKTDMCDKLGIRLIHVFGHNWEHSQRLVKSIIKNAVGESARVKYAKDTKFKRIKKRAGFEFIKSNSIYRCPDGEMYGLVDNNNRICEMMIFNKQGNKNKYVINTFCPAYDTVVVGGMSKIIHNFIQLHPGCVLEAHVNRALFDGHGWKLCGFVHVRNTSPEFNWVNVRTENSCPRHSNLSRYLDEVGNRCSSDKIRSPDDEMYRQGFVKVYDCGQSIWRLQ